MEVENEKSIENEQERECSVLVEKGTMVLVFFWRVGGGRYN